LTSAHRKPQQIYEFNDLDKLLAGKQASCGCATWDTPIPEPKAETRSNVASVPAPDSAIL